MSSSIELNVMAGTASSADQATRLLREFFDCNQGKVVRIVVSLFSRKRSLNQNDYYWKMLSDHVLPVYREAGADWDAMDIHECIMGELGYVEILFDPKGKPYRKRKESKKFTTMEMEDYLSRFRAYCSTNLGVFVPLPNEQDIHLYNLRGQ